MQVNKIKKQAYVVAFVLKKNSTICIGALGAVKFKKGAYFYVGSFPAASIQKRIRRHISKHKKHFWHIDYFSANNNVLFQEYLVFSLPECHLARMLSKEYAGIKGFGCSDCNCFSHLFYAQNLGNCLQKIKNLVDHREK